jgi:hypothetical protein
LGLNGTASAVPLRTRKGARALAPGVIFDFRQIYQTSIYC